MQESAHPGTVIARSFAIAVHRAVIVFIADRVTKTIFYPLTFDIRTGFEHIITLVHHENTGIIANIPLPQWLTIAMTLGVLFLVLHTLITSAKEGHTRAASALGILLGGACGNLYDRVMQGFVFDWILLFGKSAINLADIAIVVGAVLFFIEKRRTESPERLESAPQV
jgi:signal peptidase II